MRRAALLLLPLLVFPAITAIAAPGPVPQGAHAVTAPPRSLVGADHLLALPSALDDAAGVGLAVLAQLENQRLLPAGATRAASMPPAPPGLVYRDLHPICDLDDDGLEDALFNELDLSRPPYHDEAFSTARAISGASGETLWERENLYVSVFRVAGEADYQRKGASFPAGATNLAPIADVDGDGTCDVAAFGYEYEGDISGPLFNTPRAAFFSVHLHVLSGTDGSDLWRETFTSVQASASTPFVDTPATVVVHGFPTGFLAYATESGPKVLLKTTDVYYAEARDVLGVTGMEIIPGGRSPLKSAFHYESVHAADHIQLLDGASGNLLWQRDLDFQRDDRFTNLTWISGVADLGGDGEPEIVLDSLMIANPRTTEADHPLTGDTLFRYGRGMRVMALRGEVAGAGETLWSATLLDPLAARSNLPVEESYERLVWTHARILPDVTGDDVPEVAAQYVAEEEGLATTTAGAFRTHFIPVDGTTGEPLWDVRMQGWGFLDAAGVDPAGAPHVAFGVVDVPTRPPEGGRFPPKFVRLGALDARDGSTIWSYEKQFAQNSYVSYHMALAQYEPTLAPFDWNGDGVRDLVTPSQYAPPTGRDQVLLATASHSYQVLSGTDGGVIRTLPVWGSDGRVVACPGAEDTLTTVSGHPRRLDLTRTNVHTGETLWRKPVWNDPTPRAATSAVDLLGLGAGCHSRSDGSTLFTVNAHAFSFTRQHEVVTIAGTLGASGGIAWLDPAIRGNPRTDALFEPYSALEAEVPLAVKLRLAAVGAALGAAAGAVTLFAWRRARIGRHGSPLLVGGIVLLLLATGVLAPLATPIASAVSPLPGALPSDPIDGILTIPPDGSAAPAPSPSRGETPSSAGAPVTDTLPRVEAAPPRPPPAAAPNGEHGQGFVADGAYERLLGALAALGDDWTPAAHVRLIVAYFRDLGFNAPYSSDETTGSFEDGAALSFTHDLGDVDGDGMGDLAFDTYCMEYDACRDAYDFPNTLVKGLVEGYPCDYPHRLSAVSGQDGRILWEENLDMLTPIHACGVALVMGVVPLEERAPGLLVYRYTATHPLILSTHDIIEHDIYLLDSATGERLWTFTEIGAYATDITVESETVNLVINPLLQVPSGDGVRILPDGTRHALFLQGVGYAAAAAHTFFTPPGFTRPPVLLDAYEPLEWAARIDPETGAVLWRTDTFQPDPQRNVLPKVWDLPLVSEWDGFPSARLLNWEHESCCFDTTGDGVPDLVFKVLEWNPLPSTNLDGPYVLSSRMVIYDGDSGETVVDRYLSEDIEVPASVRREDPYTLAHILLLVPGYHVSFQTLGDVDGDGAADLLQHEEFRDYEYRRVVTVRSGRDGAEVWRLESPRDLRAFVVGDADGDGGNDFLLVDWYAWEHPNPMYDDLDAPKRTPIRLLSGRTGDVIWSAHTVMAPRDFVHLFSILRHNGIPDLDGDGVGDVVVDNPRYLDDHTVIHHLSFLSGRNGARLLALDAVGAFALPSRVGDLTGDGRDDLALLSGDMNDLWLTTHDGADGASLWSRRILSVPASGHALAFPNVRYHTIADATSGAVDLLVNLHLHVLRPYPVIYITQEGAEQRMSYWPSLEPQILHLSGATGRALWAVPRLDDHAKLAVVPGETPGLQVYRALVNKYEDPFLTLAGENLPRVTPGLGAFALAYGGVFGVGGFLTIRRERPREEDDEEVPELDF